jgi:hypothetical protein
MVMRPVPGTRAAVGETWWREPESVAMTARMAVNASADSDRPRAAASVAKHYFSSDEWRAVIEGRGDLAERQVMTQAASAANADTSLSLTPTSARELF